MKKLISLTGLLLATLTAVAHPPPPPKATSAQATAGVNNFAYMTPALVTQVATAIGGSTNGILKLNGVGTNTTLYQGAGAQALYLPLDSASTILRIGNFYLAAQADQLDFLETAGSTSLLLLDGDSVTIQEHLTIQEQLIVNAGQVPLAISSYGWGSSNHFAGGTRFESNVWAWATTTADATNSSLSDAVVVVDANGKQQEMVVGANLAYTPATRTLTATGGAAGTNLLYPGGELFARTRVATDTPIGELYHTNGTPLLVVTNSGDADPGSDAHLQAASGLKVLSWNNSLTAIKGGSEFDLGLSFGMGILYATDNLRQLKDTNGVVAIDFSDAGTMSFSLASASVGNLTFTNLIFEPKNPTQFGTNAAIYTNVFHLIVTNHLRFTNWASIAVNGHWFQAYLTNNTGNNYYVDVPTNGFTRNMTNNTGSYVVADASGTNFACLLTNGQRAVLSGMFYGDNLGASTLYFKHW